MGNTVGSKFIFRTAEDFYILGLLLADGYWRSSSIGLTSVNPVLINRFCVYLKRMASGHPIKMRIYNAPGYKRKQVAYQVYVNSRPLTRSFMAMKQGQLNIPQHFLPAYLAGRIDGDGSVDRKYRSGIRIAYGSRFDARRDQLLLGATNVSLYTYLSAGTYVLYLRKQYRDKMKKTLQRYSAKLAP